MASPAGADRPASAEGSSTRPNPFDDSDATSRKRRRTGSPVDETDPSISELNSSSAHTQNANTVPPPEAVAKATRERVPRRQPSSSKVTLNLRQNSVATSSPESSPPGDSVHIGNEANAAANKDIHQSVEAEAGPSQADYIRPTTPRTPSRRTSRGSDDMMSARNDSDVEYVDLDPEADSQLFELSSDASIPNFPFNNSGDELSDTLRQILNHIQTQDVFPSDVIASVNTWLSLFLPLIQKLDSRALLHVWENGRFWHILPELMHVIAMQTVSTTVLASREARNLITDLYRNFTLLTEAFLNFDTGNLTQLATQTEHTNTQVPEIFATDYLFRLQGPLNFAFSSPRLNEVSIEADVGRARHDIALYLLKLFRTQTDGRWGRLHRFAKVITELVPSIPKLSNCLSSVCQMLNVLSRYAAILEQHTEGPSVPEMPLDATHHLWTLLESSLSSTIEKHVSTLTTADAGAQLEAMRETFKTYLLGRPSVMLDTHANGSAGELRLPPGVEADIVAWEWHFDRLLQLIRSSQMQLRVSAASSMCANLVGIWKRFSETSNEDEKQHVLDRIGSYLLRSSIVAYLFGPNCHPEIIVESANIVGFLVINKQYGIEHTEQLWHTITTTQDPRIADALCRMITNITNLFEYNGLLGLCAKLQGCPAQNFTPAIGRLWVSVLRAMMDKAHSDNATMTFHPYQMCLQLLRGASVCANGGAALYPDLQHAAQQGLRDVLEVGNDDLRRQHREQLFLSCLADLESKSDTTLGSLWALSLAMRPATVSELSQLAEKHGFTELMVEELYHAVRQNKDAEAPSILCWPHNQPRREFVAQLIQFEPLTLDGKLGTRLWDVLVGHQAASQADRNAGWQILNDLVRKLGFRNHFLSTCFTDRLPALPRACFCQGVLEFVRAKVLPLVSDITGSFFEEEDSTASRVGLEQLWRMITTSEDDRLAEFAIRTLSGEVYLDSTLIQSFPLSRTRQIHTSVVVRCLQLLKESARELPRQDPATQSDHLNHLDDVSAVKGAQTRNSQLVFDRTIQLLVYFLGRYKSKPGFSVPDLRSFMPEAPSQVEGNPTQLKYQSFDGASQTDVKPLMIGSMNTAAALLASLREETGFQNYRAFYRGRPFAPTENDICKSLEDLQVREGLILVKKEKDASMLTSRVKAGASPLEVEISAHFDELQSYLNMTQPVARKILNLLTMLPADQYFMRIFEDNHLSHRDIFPPKHPFRTLYAIHAMIPYLGTVQRVVSRREGVQEDGIPTDNVPASSPVQDARRCVAWISDATCDANLSSLESLELRFEVQSKLMALFRQSVNVLSTLSARDAGPLLLSGSQSALFDPLAIVDVVHPSPDQLLMILEDVMLHGGPAQSLELVEQTLHVVFSLGLESRSIWEKFSASPGFATLLQNLILRDSQQGLRHLLAGMLEGIVNMEAQRLRPHAETHGPIILFLWDTFSSILREAEVHADQSYALLHICALLLARISAKPCQEARSAVLGTTELLSELLLQHESTEVPGRTESADVLTDGVVTILLVCLNEDNLSTAMEVLSSDYGALLLGRHLFPRPRRTEGDPVSRVIMHPNTRKGICDIVSRLIQYDRNSLKDVLPALHGLLPFHANREDDAYSYDLPYGNFDRDVHIRAPCGYTGLRNLSNTCYLNSLVNQLFMNVPFRKFLLNAKGRETPSDTGLLNITKRLFSLMQESWRPWIDPEEFVGSLKTFEDTPIDVHNQMDVDEFYNLLFDQLEGYMGSSDEKHRLRSFFGGQLVQQVKSKECEHVSERLEPFSAIQCDIKGKSTLNASLQAYVDGEIMEGDNKYKCSTCDRHVDAVKRACLKDIPDNLIFHLKRFDFNLRTLQRSKINDYFSFPHEIDMAPYTVERLNDSSKGEADVFELVGVLVHQGTAESGHYYSYIKERPTSTGRSGWFEFNDETVTPWNVNNLEHATFGGYESRSTDELSCTKAFSAYMLFYQRASDLKTEQQRMVDRAQMAPLRVKINPQLYNVILDVNTMLLHRYCLFDPSYPVLVSRCIQQARKADDDAMGLVPMQDAGSDSESADSDDDSGHALHRSAMWLALNTFDQVVTRAAGLPHLILYQESLQTAAMGCTDCAVQILEYFQRRVEAFRSLLQRNADAGVRRFSGDLLLSALQKVAEDRPLVYQPAVPLTPSDSSMDDSPEDNKSGPRQKSIPEDTKAVLRHIWKGFHTSLRSWEETFSFIHGFGRLGQHETAILLGDDWLLKLLRLIASDPATETRPNYQRMLTSLSRRVRPPSFASIISLIDFLLEALEPVMSADSIVEEASERLAITDLPFPWTSQEVSILLHHPRWTNSSLFVEKLVALEQNAPITEQILCRLMEAGDAMNSAVFSTLKNNIPGDSTSQLMNPFLKAGACFVQNTEDQELARKLVFHVTGQAGKLQNGEGLAFVQFFHSIMSSDLTQNAREDDIREKALQNVPDWAPTLLVSFEPFVRMATTGFLDAQLFNAHAGLVAQAEIEGDDFTESDRASQSRLRDTVQNLGVNCLIYLRDFHVMPQAPISRDAAESILRVITACREFCRENEEDSDMEHAAAYRMLYSEILPALQSQIVEELDVDVSDWDASAASSEVGIGDHIPRSITDVV